jgi:hypothetical protein
MGGPVGIDARPYARNILKDFLTLVQPIIPLEDDGLRAMSTQRVIEKIERFLGDRMGVGIGEDRPTHGIANRHAARHVDLLH